MFGTAGGIIGPWLTGLLVAATDSFSLAIAVLASLLILALPVIALRAGAGRKAVPELS